MTVSLGLYHSGDHLVLGTLGRTSDCAILKNAQTSVLALNGRREFALVKKNRYSITSFVFYVA